MTQSDRHQPQPARTARLHPNSMLHTGHLFSPVAAPRALFQEPVRFAAVLRQRS